MTIDHGVVGENFLNLPATTRQSIRICCVTEQPLRVVIDTTDKCSRAKFRPYFSEVEGLELVQLLSQVGETLAANITITDCRDATRQRQATFTCENQNGLLIPEWV